MWTMIDYGEKTLLYRHREMRLISAKPMLFGLGDDLVGMTEVRSGGAASCHPASFT